MKKLILFLVLILFNASVFSQAGSPPPKTFQIHSEKRPFIKKAERERRKHLRHQVKHKMNGGGHLHENHKK
jgi:hypothetical protein